MPSAYLMFWAVDQGSEVPVGWRFFSMCVCVFIRLVFNVFLQDGGRGCFFFFLEGGMSSIQGFFSPLKGGERDDT